MRLIRGAAGAGKTALVFREFKQALKAGERARIVVPTATLVRHYQHELARDGVVFPPKLVLSLGRLAFGHSNDAPDTSLPLRLAIREELRHGHYPEFATVAATEGLVETILENIALFENAAATPDRLTALRKPNPHAAAFLRLWKNTDAKLRARKIPNRIESVRAVIANPPTGRIWLDGFLTFSPLEWELIAALNNSAQLTLTLPDSPAFDELRRMAMSLGAKDEPLYGPARKPARTVVEATSIEREAEEIARRILTLHTDGTPFREIGIALRDTATYLPILRTALERAQIPARFYFSEPLSQHPAAIFLNGIVTNTINGWDFDEALATLRAHPAWGHSAWFDRFDHKVREVMPARGTAELIAHCEDTEQASRLAHVVGALSPNEKLPIEEWIPRVTAFAQTLFHPGLIAVALDTRELNAARSWAAGLSAWIAAIEEIEPHLTAPIPLTQFREIVSEAIDSATLSIHDDRSDLIHVMNVVEARQWNVSALFLCGMSSRDFPKKYTPNLLFTEPELDRIAGVGIKVRRAADHDRQEEALRVSLETRASEALIVTLSTHDAAGRASERSTWYSEPAIAAKPSTVIPHTERPNAGRAGAIHHPELLTALTAQHARLSATSLEDLAQCRFKFFANRSLKLRKPPDSPRDRLNPRNTGNAIHKAMELWMKGERAGSLVEIFDGEFENTIQEKHLLPGYALEVERYKWRTIAAKINGQISWPALSSESEAEVTATLPGGVIVECRIDRLDHLANHECIVVDYKSGAIKGIKDNTKNPAKLQGPLYALAAQQSRQLRTVAMMYVALQTDEIFGWGEAGNLDLEPMPEGWMEAGRDRAEARLNAFLSGEVFPEATDESQCRWCDFAKACRVEQRHALVMIEGAAGA